MSHRDPQYSSLSDTGTGVAWDAATATFGSF